MTLFPGIEFAWWEISLLALGCTIMSNQAAALLALAAPRWGLVSRRRVDRFSSRQVAVTGGPGLLLGGVVALAVLAGAPEPGPAIAAGGLFLVGLLDDLLDLRAGVKLIAQLLVALAAVALLGLPPALWGLAVVWLLLLVNASNYLDNMDGLLAGVALAQAVALSLVGMRAGMGATVLILALPGVWFLALPPARIYLGDSGSHLIGALLAFDSFDLLIERGRLQGAMLLPMLVLFAVPLADVSTVTISRWRRGRPVFKGGMDHLSHRLVRAGFPVPRAVTVLVLASAVCGAASLLLARF